MSMQVSSIDSSKATHISQAAVAVWSGAKDRFVSIVPRGLGLAGVVFTVSLLFGAFVWLLQRKTTSSRSEAAPTSTSPPPSYEEDVEITCPIAKETRKATVQGFYLSPSGKKIFLRSGTQLLKESRAVPNAIMQEAVEPKYEKTEIEIVNQDCLETAKTALSSGAKKVAVLMLASPIEPGGAMAEGNDGQEEEICRRSDIFGFMWDQSHGLAETFLYNLVDVRCAHQVNPDYASMNNNRMIHVPQVTVFRAGKNDHYAMLEDPFEVGILVSPGLDRPAYEKVDNILRYKRVEDVDQLLKLISTQLKVSYEEGYDTVILGSFGCGAFFNPPELIAGYFKKIIDTYFKGAFKKIVFAILDDGSTSRHNPEGNLKPFQKCFAH